MFRLSLNYVDKLPVYKQIVHCIIDSINKGELVHNEKLPSLHDWNKGYHVSISVIKRAFEELSHLGHIRRIHGKGFFVVARKRVVIDLRDNRVLKMNPSDMHIKLILIKPAHLIDEIPFKITESISHRLLYITRVIYYVQYPLIFQEILLDPHHLSKDFSSHLTGFSLVTLLQEHGDKKVTEIQNHLMASAITPYDSFHLDVPVGSLGTKIHSTYFSDNRQLIAESINTYSHIYTSFEVTL